LKHASIIFTIDNDISVKFPKVMHITVKVQSQVNSSQTCRLFSECESHFKIRQYLPKTEQKQTGSRFTDSLCI